MTKNTSCAHYCSILVLVGALTACGGGGGGTGSSDSAPIASNATMSTSHNISVTSKLTATDSDGDTLQYSIVSNPGAGTVSIIDPVTGIYTYTPDANVVGTDSFTFKATDGKYDSNVATVMVEVIDAVPIAVSANLTTDEDTVGNDTLIASDGDADPLTFSIVMNPTKGIVNVTDQTTGAYTYTPFPNVDGTDSFTFKVNDGHADSNIATVSVFITPVNDPPIAAGTCSNTPQTQVLTGTLSATDVESPNLLMFALNADGSGGLGPVTTAKNGIVTITDATTGEFTYQPASSGSRGFDTFAYQVTDPDGATGSATQTVVVDEKIMPLGDSITAGVIGGTVLPSDLLLGFRKPLYDLLKGAGFTFDLVGSLSDGASALPDFDLDHEGHGGLSAAQIAFGPTSGYPTDGTRAWLYASPADIVLLHAGTNNLNGTSASDIADILNEIDQWEQSAGGNHVTVLLALIIDQNPINPKVTTLNNGIQSMATTRIANGDDIIIVDQHGALTYPNDMSDQLHPNDAGYTKMANTWFTALEPIVARCGP